MKINFDQKLVTLEGNNLIEKVQVRGEGGEALKDQQDEPILEDKNITLGSVCIGALFSSNKENVKGEIKLKRFELARRVNVGGEMEITAEEIVMIKELSAELHVTLIVGQVYEMLEGKSK